MKIQEHGWKSITVNGGLCNSMRDNLYISNNPCLQSINVNGQSFYNLNSLTIENNPQLTSINTVGYRSFRETTNLILDSNCYMMK